MADTAFVSYRVSEHAIRDSITGLRSVVRERLVSELRELVPSGRIYFSVVREAPRCFNFTALVGPRASGIAQRRREARKANHGYLSFFELFEDQRG